MHDLKGEVIQYFASEYKRTRRTPSVRQILKKFGLNTKKLYAVFPGGVLEICELAKVPKPVDSFRKVEEAAKAKQALTEEKQKRRMEDSERVDLEARKAVYAAKKKEIDEKARLREEVRRLALDLSQTSEGQQAIFANPTSMSQFFRDTLANHKTNIVNEFTSFCKKRRLRLPEAICEAVGDFETYELNCRHDPVSLNQYFLEEVEWHMRRRKKEEKRKQLQECFEKSLASAKCHHCGQLISSVFHLDRAHTERVIMIVESVIVCYHCGRHYGLLCPGCLTQLKYRGELDFHCSNCDLTFSIPSSAPDARFSVRVPIRIDFT